MEAAAAQVVAKGGALPYYFLRDYQKYSGPDGKRPGDIAGLKIDLGDKLAATVIEETGQDKMVTSSAICRRATAEDLAAKKAYSAGSRRRKKPVLVAVTFEQAFTVDGRSYRGPTQDKEADTAGFSPALAKRLTEGYLAGDGRTKVGAVGHLYFDTVDEDLEAPAEDADRADRAKPAAGGRAARRKKASPDPEGAPVKKGE